MYSLFMKILIIFSIFLSPVFAQENFYYSRGENISLKISTKKISIKFKSRITQDEIKDFLATEPALGEIKPLDGATPGFFIIQLKEQTDVKKLVKRMSSRTEVDIVNPVFLIEGSLEAIPFDIFIIKFKPYIKREQIELLNRLHNVEVASVSPASRNTYNMRITSTSDLPVLEMSKLYYESLPSEWSLPDFISPIELFDTPTDPYFQNQYYFHNTGQTGGVADADIDALEAWNISTGSSSITVAVIDEGVAAHEDLGAIWTNDDEFIGDYNGDGRPGVMDMDDDGDGLIDEDSQGRQPGDTGYSNDLKDDDDENGYIDDLGGWDFINSNVNPPYEDNDPVADGNEAHGMACAGIVAANHNGIGVSGISPNSKIMAIKIFDAWGNGTSHGNAARAIDYAWQNGAHVLSNSWGYSSSNPNLWPDIVDAINDALLYGRSGKGSVVVFAAGNNANRNNNYYGYVHFPACVSGVLAVGATDKSNNIQFYSPRDEELSVVAPSGDLGDEQSYRLVELRGDVWSTDISGNPGWNPGNYGIRPPNFFVHYIWDDPGGDDYPPGNYTSHFGGTSAACPQVSGTAALILSLNSELEGKKTNPQVQNIIKEMADDMGAAGYDQDFGYGRVNANHSCLLALSYANKSTSSGATQTNNARHLAKDDGYLYEVFYSGGEIFFRRSNDNGSTWQVTKRLSEGNGSNSRPAITAYYDNSIHVVWQRNLGNRTWDIYYTRSSDHGSSWSTPSTIAQNVNTSYYQNWGAQPVIARCFVDEMYFELMVAYTSSSGIFYATKTSAAGSWSTPLNISGSYNSYIRFPSLSGKEGYFALIYDTRYYGAYSRTYDGSWSSAVKFSEGAQYYERETCVAQEKNGGDMLATWAARPTSSSAFSVFFRRGYANNSWSNFKNEFHDLDIDYRCPSITYFDSNYPNEYAIAILFHSPDYRIIMEKYYGQTGSWMETWAAYNGRDANITAYAYDAPKYFWTDVSASPYEVKLSSSYLPKSSMPTEYKNVFARRSVISNIKDNSAQCLEVSDYLVKTKSGKTYSIAFHSYPDDTVKLDLETVWDYMDSEPVKLPEDATELVYKKKIYTTLPDDSSGKKYETSFTDVSYQLTLTDAKTKSVIAILDNNGKSDEECIVNVSSFAGKEVILYPSLQIEGVSEEALDYCLVNIFGAKEIKTEKLPSLEQKTAPAFLKVYDLSLKQNYPNPFNPVTDIRFSIPDEGVANLSVYDLQGRLVKTLFNGYRDSGEFSTVWNGTNAAGKAVASGLYFYRLKFKNRILTRKMFLVR